jgi:putative chitinase
MLLQIGSRGDDVKKLQEKLGLTADGIFGKGTAEAVKTWQKNNGLTPDGLVGQSTWNKMFAESVVSQPTLITEPAPIGIVGNLKLGSLKGRVPDSVISQIPEVANKFGINTPLRLAHFLSQCSHESINFKVTQENLNYGAKGLLGTFKKYFPTQDKALLYERKPEKIANLVYGGRMGNGPESSGEGWKYHGRGFIQLTGKDNYTAFSKSIGEDCVSNPDLVATKYPLASAAWFFTRCLPKCDAGATDAVVTNVTKCVNGGTIGLTERLSNFKLFFSLLS